jgi:hypothetical protein
LFKRDKLLTLEELNHEARQVSLRWDRDVLLLTYILGGCVVLSHYYGFVVPVNEFERSFLLFFFFGAS